MDEQKQDDQLESTYNIPVPIQDITLKTSQERWTIETSGERGSERSVHSAWHDDADDYLEESSRCHDERTGLWYIVSKFQLLSRYKYSL